MLILEHGPVRAVIDPEGAWVRELVGNNMPVLFPKADFTSDTGDQKVRGGMHVCLPNFGPGGESGLAQHGFGRTSLWSVTQQDEQSVVLRLETTDPSYVGLLATLAYRLEENSLSAELSLTNQGSDPLRVAPGFHPYFALEPSETAVTVSGQSFELDALADTKFVVAPNIELITAGKKITLHQKNLGTWAIWSDQLGNYVCVEPTSGGYRFLENSSPDELLSPGDTKEFAVTIAW